MTTEDLKLDAAELHAMARIENETPAAFTLANTEIETTGRAHQDALWHRHDLIREARRLGVPWSALSRWTGLNVRSLHRIVHDQ